MKRSLHQTILLVCAFAFNVTYTAFGQCTFSGLNSAYCFNSSASTLTPAVSGGTFYGAGVNGTAFTPSLAGYGSHTVSYITCPGTYSVSLGTHAPLNTAGNSVSLNDDAITNTLSIGFNFYFFCNYYNSFQICSNGWLSFSQTALTSYPGPAMPTGTTSYPGNVVAFCWDDLYPPGGGTITYTTIGSAPTRTLVMSFVNIQHWPSGNAVTIQVQLHETTNKIQIHTTSMPGSSNAHTEGIQNIDGSVAYTVPGRNGTTGWTASNEMYEFAPLGNCQSNQVTLIDTNHISISGTPTLCLHSSTTYTASGANSYSWSGGGNTATKTMTPSAGVTVFTVNGASPNTSVSCMLTTTYAITTYSVPLNATNNPTLLCVGSTATLTGSGAATYSWDTGPTTQATTVNPIVNTTYTLYGTSAIGCKEEVYITQNVNTNLLSTSPSTAVCAGKSTSLSATNAVSYVWYPASSPSGHPFQGYLVTPNSTTTYTVDAIDQFGCPLEAMVTVTVNPVPNVSGSSPRPKWCKGEMVTLNATGGTTYSWTAPPGNPAITSTSSTVQFIVTVDVPYTYTVTGYDANGCSNKSTINFTVAKCTGLNEIATAALEIYPNPSNGLFYLRNTGTISGLHALVINGLGAQVADLQLNSEVTVLDLSKFASGIYFVNLADQESTIQTIRIIKN